MKELIRYGLFLRNLWYQYTGGFWVRNGISDGVLFNYYDNHTKNKEILVIFHGFSADKESCLQLANNLSNKYRIIIPDLLGHGKTKHLEKKHEECIFDVNTQLEHLKKFILNILGPDKKIHIIGHSMGGLLAGCFAARFPNMIKSVNLLCPAGVSMIRNSPVYNHYIQTRDNLLSIKTAVEAKELLYMLHCNYRFLPNIVFEYYSSEYNKNANVYDRIFDDVIVNNYPYLENQLHYIQSNVLIIWGENDRIIDKSCIIRMLNKLRVKSNQHILSNAGHVIHSSHSNECAEYIDLHIQDNI